MKSNIEWISMEKVRKISVENSRVKFSRAEEKEKLQWVEPLDTMEFILPELVQRHWQQRA